MATRKMIRIRSDQADWLVRQAEESGLSENRVIGALIDNAMATSGTVRVDVGGWISGPMIDPANLPEDVPQAPGLLGEDHPHGTRH